MRRLLALGFGLFSLLFLASAETYLVLPFHNVAGNQNLDWIGESLAETVRGTLASYDLSVITRGERVDAARQLMMRPGVRLTRASAIQLGQLLSAERVVQGEFEFTEGGDSGAASSGALTIRAFAIDLEKISRGPEWTEAGSMAELSKLQTSLAWTVLEHASPDRAPTKDEFFETRPPIRIDAIENYIRGLLAPDLEQKHRFFTQAVNLEPEFSQPCYQLGRMQWEESSYRVAARWLERVKPSDAEYLSANFLLGLCRYHSGLYGGAMAAFRLVADAVPLAEVYNNLALTQYREGLPQAALESLRWVVSRDPSDPDYQFNTGYVLWRLGDLDSAVEPLESALELDPQDADAREFLERCRTGQGPRRGDLSGEGLERLKERYEPEAYRAALTFDGQRR